MLKRLLVAATLVAFAFGAMTLAGCAKKQEEAPADQNMGSEPAPSGGAMDSSSMADSSMMSDSTMAH